MGQEDRFSTTDVDVLVDTGKAVVGLRPSFSSHIAGANVGHPSIPFDSV